MVKIEFEFEHEAGTFRDTIVLPGDHSLTDVQIDAMKVQRFEAWQRSLVEQEETEQTEEQ
jgi:hypothetical protein